MNTSIQKNNSKSRIIWVDLFKGISIISVVLGHAGAPFITYIYLFHMPAFMFISGFTYRGENYSLVNYFKQKFRNILLPAFMINSFYILFYVIIQNIGFYHYLQNGAPIGIIDRFKMLFLSFGTPDFGGATWFLVVLFTIEIIFKLLTDLCKMLRRPGLDLVLAFIPSGLGWFFITNKILLPYMLDLSLFGCTFFMVGIATGRFQLLQKHIDHKVMFPISLITVIFFGSFYFAGRLPMNWPTRTFAVLPIQLISSFSGIYLCYLLSKVFELSDIFRKIITYIGKHTYTILVTHFFIFRFIFSIMAKINILPINYLQNLTPSYSPYPFWFLITLLTILICMLISWISEKNRILNYIINAKFDFRVIGGHDAK